MDVKDKFVRKYKVTPVNVHDSQVFDALLDSSSTSKDVWADSAYSSEEARGRLKEAGYRKHLQCKRSRYRKLTKWE